MGAYFDFRQTQEQWQADDIHAKITPKMTAQHCADYCAYVFENFKTLRKESDIKTEREVIEPFVISQGLEMPRSAFGWLPEKLRLETVKWWEKKLRIKQTRSQEHLKIKSGLVRKYCSDDLLNETRERKARMKEWLALTELHHTSSETVLNLKTIHDSSLANQNLRVQELNVRCKGIAEYYNGLGYRGIFVTTTASSSWHRLKTTKDAQGKKTKSLNFRYNGATPKDVQNMFNQRFSYVRTWLSNRAIDMIGVRVAEPHQDGCTHWHFVLWFKNGKEAKLAIQAFRKYFLFYEGAPEQGAMKHRLTFDTVNPKKGDAIGYILAYINKGITGEHIDDHTDKNGEKIATGQEGAERTQAWARCWGIRQFQFLGAPPVNVYREFRRVWCDAMGRGQKNQVTVPTFEQYQKLQEFYKNNPIPEEAEPLWYAANEGNFCRYIQAYYNAQGQQSVNKYADFLMLCCALPRVFCGLALTSFTNYFVSQKPKLLKHGFKEDMKELAKYYGSMQRIPDEVINKLESFNGYLEPKSLVYGVVLDKFLQTKSVITRKFNGYFEKFWELKTGQKQEQVASVQERIDAYAGVRGASGLDDEFWGDVVNFGSSHGVFSAAKGRATSDLWQ